MIAAAHDGGRMRAQKTTRPRSKEQRAKSTRVAIVVSLFLVLLAAALLVGGRAMITPLLQSAAGMREAKRVGDVVYSMPDGTFCRHLSFDNATSELVESAIEQCPSDLIRKHGRAPTGFAWGGR